MPCGHFKCWSSHAYLLSLEKSYTRANISIHVLSAPFGQHEGLVNASSVHPVHLVQVRPVQVGPVQVRPVQVRPVQVRLVLFYECWL